jgi:hypothetical protein
MSRIVKISFLRKMEVGDQTVNLDVEVCPEEPDAGFPTAYVEDIHCDDPSVVLSEEECDRIVDYALEIYHDEGGRS